MNPRTWSAMFPLVALLTVAQPRPGAALDRISLLPDDVVVSVRISNTSALLGSVSNSPLGRLWADEKMQEFLGKPELEKHFLASQEERLGSAELARLQVDEYKMLKGELILAAPIGKGEPKIYGIGQMSEEDYRASLDMDRRIAEGGKGKSEIQRVDFRGIQLIHMIETPAPQAVEDDDETEKGAAPKQTESWQAFVGGTLVLAEDRAWVEKCVAALQASPAAEPKAADPVVEVRVDGRRLMALLDEKFRETQKAQAGVAAAAGQPAPMAEIDSLAKLLGLGEVGDLRVTLRLSDKQMDLLTALEVGERRQGVLSILDTRPIPLDTAVPYSADDLYYVKHERIDLAGFWTALEKILTTMNPAAGAMIGAATAQFGINLGRDVLPHVGTQFTTIGRVYNGVPQELVYWSLKNSEQIASTLGQLLGEGSPARASLGTALKSEDFRGHRVYVIQPPAQGEQAQPAKAFCVAGDRLLFGDDAMLRAAVQALDAADAKPMPFTQSAHYRALLKEIPPEAFQFGIIDWGRLITAAIDPARSESLQLWQKMLQSRQADDDDKGLLSGIDWSKLPPADHLAKFLGPSLQYGVAKGGTLTGRFTVYYPVAQPK